MKTTIPSAAKTKAAEKPGRLSEFNSQGIAGAEAPIDFCDICGTTEQLAEKCQTWGEIREPTGAGAKAQVHFVELTARLKSGPVTKHGSKDFFSKL